MTQVVKLQVLLPDLLPDVIKSNPCSFLKTDEIKYLKWTIIRLGDEYVEKYHFQDQCDVTGAVLNLSVDIGDLKIECNNEYLSYLKMVRIGSTDTGTYHLIVIHIKDLLFDQDKFYGEKTYCPRSNCRLKNEHVYCVTCFGNLDDNDEFLRSLYTDASSDELYEYIKDLECEHEIIVLNDIIKLTKPTHIDVLKMHLSHMDKASQDILQHQSQIAELEKTKDQKLQMINKYLVEQKIIDQKHNITYEEAKIILNKHHREQEYKRLCDDYSKKIASSQIALEKKTKEYETKTKEMTDNLEKLNREKERNENDLTKRLNEIKLQREQEEKRAKDELDKLKLEMQQFALISPMDTT